MRRWLVAISGVLLAACSIASCALPRDGLIEETAGVGGTTSTTSTDSGTTTTPTGSGGSTTTSTAVGGSGGGSQVGCAVGYECVPDIAAGRFVRVIDGPVPCGGQWDDAAPYAPPVQPGCDCGCSSPIIGNCSPGQFAAYRDGACNSLIGYAPSTGCMSINNEVHRAFILQPSVASASSCSPTGGGPNDIDESTVCELAAPAPASCGSGMVCVPDGTGALCNALPDGSTCGAGYGTSEQAAEILGDTRVCTCSCGPSTGQVCNASATVYTGGSCSSGTTSTVPANGACVDTVDSQGTVYHDVGTWTGGACTPNPTTGSVSFGATELLCCR